MKMLFTICGRAGSKGIKNKNIRQFVGKPLPYYTLSAIDLYLNSHKESEYDIVLNTDSDELIEMIKDFRIRKVDIIKRKPELGGDSVGKIDVIHNCLEIMEVKKEYKYDIIVDMDITSPLRKIKDIDNLIKKHIETGADVTTSVTKARRNPFFNQLKKTKHGYKKVCKSDFTARQQAPKIYDMNASVYAYKPDFLVSGRQILDGYVEVTEMYDTGILDLDQENDMKLMQVIAEYLFENDMEFRAIYDNI